jgi:hypothetical protein
MSITGGATTNSITVSVDATIFTGAITVYGINGCGNGPVSPAFSVQSVVLPGAHGNIVGPNKVCKGTTGVVYSVPPVLYASGYVWSVPPGATIISGQNTTSIVVDYSPNSSNGRVQVYATNACGSGPTNPTMNVTVNPIPAAAVITYDPVRIKLTSNQPSNNQWYLNGTAIPGATGKNYTPTVSGDYYDIITKNGCSSVPSNTITVVLAKSMVINTEQEEASTGLTIYPNPNEGQFNYEITLEEEENLSIEIYNNIGSLVYKELNLKGNGILQGKIDLTQWPFGIYTLKLQGSRTFITTKIVIGR